MLKLPFEVLSIFFTVCKREVNKQKIVRPIQNLKKGNGLI
jgi:hypothetical protein